MNLLEDNKEFTREIWTEMNFGGTHRNKSMSHGQVVSPTNGPKKLPEKAYLYRWSFNNSPELTFVTLWIETSISNFCESKS